MFFLVTFTFFGCASSSTVSDRDGSVHQTDGRVPGSTPVGWQCSSSSDCESAICLGIGAEYLCSVECGDCPPETFCTWVDPQNAPPGETTPPAGFYCVPDRGGLCKPCDSDINCIYPSDKCLDLGDGEAVCGRNCAYDGTCPAGYECIDDQCHPLGGTCRCTSEKIGQERSCHVTNEHGTCSGVETCTESGWAGCDARTPSPQVCDGIDNNCDGIIPPEEFDNNDSGVIDCLDDCIPEPEKCDGQDNDCDGITDNGDPVEMCGVIPNGTPACINAECVVGECAPGYANIDGIFETGCECAIGTSGGPTCNNAEDLGSLDDTGQFLTRSGVLGENGEVWYRVRALDLPVSDMVLCNTFHFRIKFLANPGDSYKMEVIAEDCSAQLECPLPITDFQWYTNFRQGSGETAVGQCPCMNDPTVNGEGYNQCTDNSRVYYVRVFKVSGSPVTCDAYELEFSNGVYSH